jgi:hypothetical protein
MDGTTALALYGAVVASGGLGWQVFQWRKSHAFDVRVTLKQELIAVGSGKYEVTVTTTNHGATNEAVQEIWLRFREHEDELDGLLIPSVRITRLARSELPPDRNVRYTIDLLATRFGPFPSELTAVVLLESGRHVESETLRTDDRSLGIAVVGTERDPRRMDDDPPTPAG